MFAENSLDTVNNGNDMIFNPTTMYAYFTDPETGETEELTENEYMTMWNNYAMLDHGGVDRIMLDNFSVPDTKKAVEIIAHRYETESSGGITFDTIRDYAEQGVDFISVGALTHSVKGLDMSFKAC